MLRNRNRLHELKLYLAVGCGAAIGSLFRYLSGLLITSEFGQSELLATAFVNVLGSFAIMFFATLTGPDGRMLVGPAGRQFVMSGLCGGFTTFSTMSFDTFTLLVGSNSSLAVTYMAGAIALSLTAAWAGHILAERFNRMWIVPVEQSEEK